jgi:hypothetical protein
MANPNGIEEQIERRDQMIKEEIKIEGLIEEGLRAVD